MSNLDTILTDKYGPFMDLTELACVLRIKKASMYQQIHQGKLAIDHVKLGKKYLFPTVAVARHFENNMTPATNSSSAANDNNRLTLKLG